MADEKIEEKKSEEKKSSGIGKPILIACVGCLVLLAVAGIIFSIITRFFMKQVGTSFLEKAIENKTGVKTNLGDVEKGKMSFTDEKTGAKLDIGSGKIPDTFPKDFPIYPGAKVVGALSGAQNGKSNGFWITLSTADGMDKVEAFYKDKLAANGWKTTSTFSSGDTSSTTVSKGSFSGSVAVTRAKDSKETEIVIVLGEEGSPQPTSE